MLVEAVVVVVVVAGLEVAVTKGKTVPNLIDIVF